MSYIIECEQGTLEWHAARCGKPTASNFKIATETTAKGLPTAKMTQLAAKLAMERIYGKPLGDGYEVFSTWQMQRGQVLEGTARQLYEEKTGNVVLERGIEVTDDHVFGYSTDGRILRDGAIEIKCLLDVEKIMSIYETGDTSDYDHQMQGGMWITGRKWCDFIMYVPQLANVGADLYIKRVMRDDNFIDAMVEKLIKFEAGVRRNVEIFTAYGKKVA